LSEIVVITAKGCPGCEYLKRVLPADSGVKFLDITEDPEAARIAQELDIMTVPTFVVINREVNELCSLDKNFKPIKCVKRVEKPNKPQ